jgi:UDP-glucose 4-epimerase
MLDAIDNGQSPTVMGDGSEAFDFVGVDDCGRANICAMKADTTDTYYNVGTGKRTTLNELAELLLEITGTNKPIHYAASSQATLVRNRIGCPKKASNEIGFTATTELREGLQRLIAWRDSHKAKRTALIRVIDSP